ncbi:cellulose synthase complex periplasmic endoglucanase BcsZ [Vibrio methylphosphonaticus]|uniref:cellulose synthase complex periplasmic endoglucanase BcsZ n=1 Tax=Vibrio methylphosphonaticus TaxID=2946866 RepID=UPI002029B998|nr:cellulose synthase complex periplasmic endoglucanase BcsZ [Vibrio methylphosphonaticus]MCL9773969.1 cellulose synthase complex periplasmic endoglucanase BcsZ [Vibrio methylphosphonaticus]
MTRLITILLCMASFSLAWAQDKTTWQQFKDVYIIDNGRVVDGSDARRITTSEGQSYALFFALIENDRKTFDEVYEWTRNHLAEGDLTARLPAWLWGTSENRQTILDSNSASDSDLWIAYTLIEAGRLWQSDYYQNVGHLLALRILAEETISLTPGHRQLVPGKQGFISNSVVKLNPSYVPLPLLAKFVHSSRDKRWHELWSGSMQLLLQTQHKGLSPDWVLYDGSQYYYDNQTTSEGSYNAIRTYLWAGMMPVGMDNQTVILESLKPLAKQINTDKQVPLMTFANEGLTEGIAPIGFKAAMLPFLAANGDDDLAATFYSDTLAQLITDRDDEYYNNVLAMFGTAWYLEKFRFSPKGELMLPWAENEPSRYQEEASTQTITNGQAKSTSQAK